MSPGRYSDALHHIEGAGANKPFNRSEVLQPEILLKIRELHPPPDDRDALPNHGPLTAESVTPTEVERELEELTHMKASGMSPWTNELIQVILKNDRGLQSNIADLFNLMLAGKLQDATP
jgi:hypothetical protein